MASPNWQRNSSVKDQLFERPQRFGFFQAIRLLCLLRKKEAQADASGDKLVRFRTRASLAFPATEIYDLQPPEEGREDNVPEMTVNFMGLTGPMGVMPNIYTELLIERELHYRDDTAHRFFDIFSHRVIALFERASEKYHFYLAYEQGSTNSLTRYLLDLVGMGFDGQRRRLGVQGSGLAGESLAFYSGLLSQRPASAQGLMQIVSHYFGVPVRVEPCQGRWLRIPADYRSSLGGFNIRLGVDYVLGDRAWDRQGKFRLTLGPLTQEQYRRLLPNGEDYPRLAKFVRWYAGPGLDFDVQLILQKQDVSTVCLGIGSHLGWIGWLNAGPSAHEAHGAVLNSGV